MNLRKNCPGCGHDRLVSRLALPQQPAVLNYRFRTRAAALRVPRGDLTLVQCHRCGLIFNASFDPNLIPYDSRYENRQCFSDAFQAHLNSLIQRLVRAHKISGQSVLEIGCGKGDFLRQICAAAGAEGDGYDTSYEGPATSDDGRVRFHVRYVAAPDIQHPYALALCRHVVEHVPDIGAFFDALHAIAVAADRCPVYVETPLWEWIVENGAFWDVFYEHCNYFPGATLIHLAQRSGFRVLQHRTVFGGQYQALELIPSLRRPRSGPQPPGIDTQFSLALFRRRRAQWMRRLSARIQPDGRREPWALWGAGAKGVALANQLPELAPTAVIDSNPAKQGGVLPGTRIPIIAPTPARLRKLRRIVIVNPNYSGEIRKTLSDAGYGGAVTVLDQSEKPTGPKTRSRS